MSTVSNSKVADFYVGRSILITGGSGFLGKVLLEKFLRSVPDVERLFLLIRPQNEMDAKQRLEHLLKSNIFDRVRSEYPERVSKLIPINGNIMEENLALSQEDTEMLIREVSVVFHCAATVKFDEALRISVQMNVVGTQRLMALCRRMKNLISLVHASTAYANCDRPHIIESVYPPPIQPQKLIGAIEWMNDDMVLDLTPHIVGQRPNTYTLTKALAEYILVEECQSLPITIVRPSIIGAVWREPVSGWVDNLNGPTGLFAAVGKGLLRTMLGDPTAKADLVPVDLVSNFMIVAAWHRTVAKCDQIPVINVCSGRLNPLYWGKVLESFSNFYKNPLENLFRVPKWQFTLNRVFADFAILINHLIPAYAVDTVCRVMGRRPRMVRIYGKLLKAVESLEYFTTREWDFQTKGMLQIWNEMGGEDQKLFNFDVRQLNWDHYLEMYMLGVKKYILKEEISNLPKARKQLNRLQLWTTVVKAASWVILVRVLVRKSALVRKLWFYAMKIALVLYGLLKKPIQAVMAK